MINNISGIARFDIKNIDDNSIILFHEPECWEYELEPKGLLTIEYVHTNSNFCLMPYINGEKHYLAIISDEIYRVLKDGVDVFAKYYD